jgi:hypothetical protein
MICISYCEVHGEIPTIAQPNSLHTVRGKAISDCHSGMRNDRRFAPIEKHG